MRRTGPNVWRSAASWRRDGKSETGEKETIHSAASACRLYSGDGRSRLSLALVPLCGDEGLADGDRPGRLRRRACVRLLRRTPLRRGILLLALGALLFGRSLHRNRPLYGRSVRRRQVRALRCRAAAAVAGGGMSVPGPCAGPAQSARRAACSSACGAAAGFLRTSRSSRIGLEPCLGRCSAESEAPFGSRVFNQ